MKPVEWSEAIAYLAEAFYREARGLPPFGSSFIRAKARSLAKNMLKTGRHEVNPYAAGICNRSAPMRWNRLVIREASSGFHRWKSLKKPRMPALKSARVG